MTAALTALAVAVLLLAYLVAGLLRSHAEILKSLHDLGAGLELDRKDPGYGITAPETAGSIETVAGQTPDGETVAMSLVGHDTLVAFLSSGCSTCQEFWSAFATKDLAVPGDASLVVVTRGPDEESASALRERAPTGVPVVMSDQTWDDFKAPGAPYFAYVDRTGRVVGEGTGTSWPQVTTLLNQARADAALRSKGNGVARDQRDLIVLGEAGITPGDPSLYGEPS